MKKYFLTAFAFLIYASTTAQSTQNALHFDGIDDHVQTTFPAITGSNARTVEAWIKTSANANPSTGGTQQVITEMGSFVTGGRFTFNVLWGNAIRLEVGGSGLSGTVAINDGLWHHVACVYDPLASNKISLYVDGTLDTAGNITTPVNTSSGNMLIGRRVDNTRYWNGSIDEVRVWNTAKTATQINNLKDEELCSSQTGLVAYYRCNEGTAGGTNTNITTLLDNSASSNDGTLTNFGLSGSTSNWVTGTSITAAPNTDSTFTIEQCGFYSTPKGFLFLSSGSTTETVTNSQGCDSIMTFNVTILPTSFSLDTIEACDSFRSTLGVLYTSSRIFNEVFSSVNGCDSTVNTLLLISDTEYDTVDITACESYTSPSGRYTWTTSGTYSDTLSTSRGCDSILSLNINIALPTTSSITDTFCDQYVSPTGVIYTTSGVYIDTILNAQNCDSIIKQTITIATSQDTSFTAMACDSFASFSGQNTWYTSGDYLETFTNINGCDSLINYEVEINYTTSATLTLSECEPFSSPGGTFIFTSGTYTDILTNTQGCDSILTLEVTVTQNRPVATKNNDNLEVDLTGLNYQWIDCNSNNAPIPMATAQTFRPSKSGDYAVLVVENGCTDTSNCVNYPRTASLEEINVLTAFLSPNPAKNYVNIQNINKPFTYRVINQKGQTLHSGDSLSPSISTLPLVDGVYHVEITSRDGVQVLRLVVVH